MKSRGEASKKHGVPIKGKAGYKQPGGSLCDGVRAALCFNKFLRAVMGM